MISFVRRLSRRSFELLFKRPREAPQPTPRVRTARLGLAMLEDRWCPAGTWTWNGPIGGGDWSNAAGTNWLLNGAAVQANQYPGMANSLNDIVQFTNGSTGPATLDVSINFLQGLNISGWNDTLTLNQSLTVYGTAMNVGQFTLTDATSSIVLANNSVLELAGNTSGTWSGGTISAGTGPAGTSNSTFYIFGALLGINSGMLGGGGVGPTGLGVNMLLHKNDGSGTSGIVDIENMGGNLPLTGASNYIEVDDGGILRLDQAISTAGTQDTLGGISFAAAHTGTLSIQIDSGGELDRSGTWFSNVPNSVSVAGVIDNFGKVAVSGNNILNITGTDDSIHSGMSFWQASNDTALLQVGSAGQLKAAGAFYIDSGTVQLTAPGGGTLTELDGTGVQFGGDSATNLTVVDSVAGMQGTVAIGGDLWLGSLTTTTLNFNGATNTADLLDVRGELVLAGTLQLNGNQKPTQALYFLDSSGGNADISGSIRIQDNVGGTDTGTTVNFNAQLIYYQVTIT